MYYDFMIMNADEMYIVRKIGCALVAQGISNAVVSNSLQLTVCANRNLNED